jgi:microcystin-dependent protein
MDTLDQFVSRFCVVGMIADFAGPTAPSGWLICDGRTVSRTTYSKLFAVIGGYWGAGDGSTTFNLPNMNGRAAVGPGSMTDQGGNVVAFGFATAFGYVYNTIQQANLPNYTLTTNAQGAHAHGETTFLAGGHGHSNFNAGYHSHPGSFADDHAHTGATDVQGSHNHTVHLPGQGVGTSGGSFNVMSDFFGAGDYGTSTNGAHNHNYNTNLSGPLHLGIVGDGDHTHTITTVPDHTHTIPYDGTHTHTVTLGGGGTALTVLSPIAVVTKIIYAGAEAAIVTAADIPATPAGSEIEALREEIAALRALFETPRARMLSAPSRGPH